MSFVPRLLSACTLGLLVVSRAPLGMAAPDGDALRARLAEPIAQQAPAADANAEECVSASAVQNLKELERQLQDIVKTVQPALFVSRSIFDPRTKIVDPSGKPLSEEQREAVQKGAERKLGCSSADACRTQLEAERNRIDMLHMQLLAEFVAVFADLGKCAKQPATPSSREANSKAEEFQKLDALYAAQASVLVMPVVQLTCGGFGTATLTCSLERNETKGGGSGSGDGVVPGPVPVPEPPFTFPAPTLGPDLPGKIKTIVIEPEGREE